MITNIEGSLGHGFAQIVAGSEFGGPIASCDDCDHTFLQNLYTTENVARIGEINAPAGSSIFLPTRDNFRNEIGTLNEAGNIEISFLNLLSTGNVAKIGIINAPADSHIILPNRDNFSNQIKQINEAGSLEIKFLQNLNTLTPV